MISVNNKQNFVDYLIKHKIKFSEEFNMILNEYLGKDYIFVLSWLSNPKEYKNNIYPIEVFITFKTPKIFFPLKFTSIYGHSNITIFLYVINFVTPEIFDKIMAETKIEYLMMYDYKPLDEFSKFFFDVQSFKELKYTKIAIKTEANNFVNDLWINPNAPLRISIVSMIYSNLNMFFVILFGVLSSISSLIAGSIIFYNYKPNYTNFMVLGLMNILSIFGIIFIANNVNIDDLALRKPSEKKSTRNLLDILLRTIIWAFGLSIIFLTITELRFTTLNKTIDELPFTFFYSFIFIITFRTIYWKNYLIGSYIMLFSLTFNLLSYSFYQLLVFLVNNQSYFNYLY